MKLVRKSKIPLLLTLLLSSGFASAQTYYVDGPGGAGIPGGGRDSNSGQSLSTPLATITEANTRVAPGDTVLVRGGIYNEEINPALSGTQTEKITYRGYNGELPKIHGINGKSPVRVKNRSHIIVDGFSLYARIDSYRAAIRFDGEYNELRNSHIINPAVTPGQRENHSDYINSNFPEFGVVVSRSKFNTLEGNIISGWRQGLAAPGAENLTVRNNIIAGNIHTQIAIGPRDGRVGMDDSRLLRQLYEGNIIGGSLTSDGIQTEGGFKGGSDPVINTRGIVIRDNTFYFNAENALDFKSGGDIVVENNLFVATLGDNDGMGVRNTSTGNTIERGDTITMGSSRKSERIIIRKNRFYDNSSGSKIRGSHWKFYNNTLVANNRDANGPNSRFESVNAFTGVNGSWSGGVILNNIIVDQKHAAIAGDEGRNANDRIDYNLYANVYGAVSFVVGRGMTARAVYFDGWKTNLIDNSPNVVGKESNSFIGNPRFINVPRNGDSGYPSFAFQQEDIYNPVYPPVITFSELGHWFPYDFHLQPASDAIDKGGFLTNAVNSGNNSTRLRVRDSKLFFDGYGISGETGDIITIGSSQPVEILTIDYPNNIITLKEARSWANGSNVTLPYHGSRPDIGAFEFTAAASSDTTAPIITLEGAEQIDITLGELFTDPGATAMDDRDGPVTLVITGQVDTTQTGHYTITYSATDRAGNESTETRVVIVSPAAPGVPVITPGQSFTIAIDSGNSLFIGDIAYTGGRLLGSRIVSGNASGAFRLVPVAPNYQRLRYTQPNQATAGTYTLTITLTNQSGESQAEEVMITLSGNGETPPPGNTPVTVDGDASEWNNMPTMATTDGQPLRTLKVSSDEEKLYFLLEGNNITASMQLHLNIDNNSTTGYQNSNWNSSGIDYLVENGNLYRSTADNASWSWSSANSSAVIYRRNAHTVEMSIERSALSGLGGTIRLGVVELKSDWSINSLLPQPGNRLVAYSITNPTVPVPDTTPPVITLNGPDNMNIIQGESFTDPGATAVDEQDGAVQVAVENRVNSSEAGSYTITYSALDSAGNRSSKSRVVNVTPPGGGGNPITVDGDASDWSAISPAATGWGQNLEVLKISSDAEKFYFLLEGENIGTNMQLYLNVDDSNATGYQDSRWSNSGVDYLIENGSLYRSTTNDTRWSWAYMGASAVIYRHSASVVEISIEKSALSALNETIRVGGVELNSSWNTQSTLPVSGEEMTLFR